MPRVAAEHPPAKPSPQIQHPVSVASSSVPQTQPVAKEGGLVEVAASPERTHALELYQTLKTNANSAFQRSEWDAALQGYQDAVDVLSALPGIDAEVLHLSQIVRANVVLVFLKMGRYEEARMLATFLLQDDAPMPQPLMCKVLFRRSSAMAYLGDLDGAIGDLEAAKHFSPTPDPAIEDELAKLRKRRTSTQTPTHVVVEAKLASMHCRLVDAQFDISEHRFTLHCRPYYLRLVFDQRIAEGRDERATYNVETNVLTIYLPKETPFEAFTNLHDPSYLIATHKQRRAQSAGRGLGTQGDEMQTAEEPSRKKVIEVIASSTGDGDDEDDELETEFVQSLASALTDEQQQDNAASQKPTYGFDRQFSNVFATLDETTVYDAIDLRQPDIVSEEERRVLRVAEEQRAFHEDEMWCSLADEEGEVEHLLANFTPAYVLAFEDALARDGTRILRRRQPQPQAQSSTVLPADAAEEETTGGITEPDGGNALQAGVVPLWAGNIASFVPPAEVVANPFDDTNGATASPHAQSALTSSLVTPMSVDSFVDTPLLPVTPSLQQGLRLAIPKEMVEAVMTTEENDMLARLRPARLREQSIDLMPPPDARVLCLTLDLLLTYVFDHITTEGRGTSESVWTLCKLSPSLSWLDTQDSVYDVCVAFARRALIFPLHRHLDLIRRCFRDVGLLCLLGPSHVVKALLAVKFVLDHSEHKLVLSTLFLNPLILHWQRRPRNAAAALLQSVALELHVVATRPEPVSTKRRVETLLSQQSARSAALAVCSAPRTVEVIEYPITVTTLGLPIA